MVTVPNTIVPKLEEDLIIVEEEIEEDKSVEVGVEEGVDIVLDGNHIVEDFVDDKVE